MIMVVHKSNKDFTIFVRPITTFADKESFVSSDNTSISLLPNNSYVVSMNGTKSYETTFSRDCTGNMIANETNTCIIISNDI